jgi:hypothetical protein
VVSGKRLLLAGVLVGVGGCLFPSLDDYAGSTLPSDAGTTDTSVIVDASGDSSPPPADAKVDTSIVDSSTVDSSPIKVCTGTFLFCDDFDTFNADPFGFQTSYSSGSGTAAVNAVDFKSAPWAYEVKTKTTNAMGGAQFALKQIVTGTFANVSLNFDARIDLPSTSGLGPAESILFRLGNPNVNAFELVWSVTASTTTISTDIIQAGKSYYPANNLVLAPLVAQQWKHVSISVKPGPPPTLVVTYDQTQLFSAALHFVGEPNTIKFDPDLEINMGIFYLDTASAPWQLEFDNVLVK